MFACVSLAVMGSVALATVSKSWLRSPVAAPEVSIELLSKPKSSFVDLEDHEPIYVSDEPTWASSAVDRALAAAELKAPLV
jgi:hypothetical protein